MRLSCHVQNAEQSLFNALASLPEINQELSQKVLELYQSHFCKPKLPPLDFSGKQLGDLGSKTQMQRALGRTFESVTENDEIDSDDGFSGAGAKQNQETGGHSVKSQFFINQSLAKDGASCKMLTNKPAQKPQEIRMIPLKVDQTVIKPGSVNFLVSLFAYLPKCLGRLDPIMSQVINSAIEMVFNPPFLTFQGFSDNRKIQQAVIGQLCNSLNTAFISRTLPQNLHNYALSVLNNQQTLLLRTLNDKLDAIRSNPTESIESAKSVLSLAAHLDVRKKQSLIHDALGLAWKNRDGTDLIDSRLFTSGCITSPHFVSLMILVTSLLADPNCSTTQDGLKLLTDVQISKLVKICHYSISLFTRRSNRQKAVIDFQTVQGVYLKLLLQITAMISRQQEASKHHDQTYITSESVQLTLEEERDEYLTVNELFQYLVKQSLDRDTPLITHKELVCLLNDLVTYQDKHVISSARKTHYQRTKTQLYDVLETLCMFSARAKLQGINQQLFEKLCEPIPGSNNLNVNETRDSSNSASKMEHFFANLRGSAIFEETALKLVQLEIKGLNGSSGGVTIDQTASHKLMREIIQFLQTLPLNDSRVPDIVSFGTGVLKAILGYQNAFKPTQEIQPLQNHAMTLTQRLFQSSKCLKDSSEQHYRGIFESTLKLLISQIWASQQATNFDESGDYFQLMLEEFVKLFRRKSFKNAFLVDITEVVFDLVNDDFKNTYLSRCSKTDATDSQEKNGQLDHKVSLLISLIEMRQSLLKRLVEAMIERFQENQLMAVGQLSDSEFTRILGAVNRCVRMIAIDHEDVSNHVRPETRTGLKSEMQINTDNLLQGFQEEQTVCFLQLWMLIAVQGYYKYQDSHKQRQLAEFAALTPTIDFNQDFQLLVRNNPQKDLFQHFSDDVKDIFKKICVNESVQGVGDTFNFRQQVVHRLQRQSSSRVDLKASMIDGENSEDEQAINNAAGIEEQFGTGESVFLALYAFINSMSLYSDKSTQLLRYSKHCSLVESIITLYSNEKIFNWEAFLKDQEGSNYSLQQQNQTYQSFSNRVDSLSTSLFNLQMIMHLSQNQSLTKDHRFVEELIRNEFVLLLKAACHNQLKVRKQSMAFLVKLSNNFPSLLTKKQVLYTFLDILTALSAQFDDVYDSMSHPIVLQISQEQIVMDPQESVRSQIQAELLSLLASMFVKAVVIGEQELYQVFDLYKADLDNAAKSRSSDDGSFGLSFFDQLKSQVDIKRFYSAYNPQFQNFHQFRLLAISQPAQFSKAIDQLMPVAFSVNNVLEIAKMQQQSKIDELSKIRPFYNAQTSHMTGPADKPSERGLASDDDNGRLLTRAFKAIMKIDMAFHIHFTSSVADKKRQLEQVVKMHYYLAMGSKSPEDGEKLVQRRSLKFLGQDYNSVLQKQSSNLMGVFNQLISLISSSQQSQGRISLIQIQVIQLMSCIPFLSLTRETVESYCLLVRRLTSTAKNPELESALLDMLPFTTAVLLSRLQLAQTKEQKVGGKRNEIKKLKLSNRIKETINRIQTDQLDHELDAKNYDFQAIYDRQGSPIALDKIKLHSSSLQNINAAQVIECVETFLDILKDEMLLQVLRTSDEAQITSIVRAYVNLLSCGECLQPQMTGYANLALKLIRMGHMIYSILQACINLSKGKRVDNSILEKISGELAQQLQQFALKFYRLCDRSDFKKLKYSGMIATVQLVEDIKYLTKLNELPMPHAESARFGFRGEDSVSSVSTDKTGVVMIEQLQQFILSQIKQKVLAWNFQEQMQPSFESTGSQVLMTQAQAKAFVQKFPKLALKIVTTTQASPTGVATFGSSSYKQLEQSLTELIKQSPHIFMRMPEALDLYIRASLQETPKNNQLRVCSFWRVHSFLRLIKYLSFKFYQQEAVNQLALKPLEYADPKTVIFYLPQLFQSLRFDNSGRLKEFFKRKSRQSASFAHHLLWFCKVESEHEQQHGRKVPLPLPETLNKTAADLYEELMSEKQMSQHQAAFFRTETEFFEKITSISGLLKPSQSKDEKKAQIRQSLMEYNKEIPECVYLPTNQTYKVVGIVTSSGMPMQSAARVPILVSFEVEDYPGPDNDPILQRQDMISSVIQNSLSRHSSDRARMEELLWSVIQPNSQLQLAQKLSLGLFSPKGVVEEVRSPTGIRNSKPFLFSSASPNPDKRGRLNSQASDVNTIPFEDFAQSKLGVNAQVGAYQMRPHFKRMFTAGSKRGSQYIQPEIADNVVSERQNQLIEDQNERQRHKELIMKSYFDSTVSKRENEMLTLAIKYVENLQEIKHDGISSSNVSAIRKAKKQINIAAQRDANLPQTKVISCIFKANDDLRQDILALQVIKLFQKIFKQCDLDLYVCPYNCISNRTGDQRLLGGIIEVIPNSYSRDQLGKAFELDLYKYFLKRYGSETSEEFRFARLNFVKSLAAYCVVSYILQIKDRHNGNIMIDDSGHLIHIDFGFIFDWSPGKDMRFERSNFKLTQEFVDIMGGYRSEAFNLFVTRVVQGFLAVRRYSEEFVNLTELMHYSGFPCFKPPSLTNLEWRFRKDLDDFQAAIYMKGLIEHARTTWTTVIYDLVQYKQNKIVF